jgi:lipooligosaccharide transport system permease protein
MTGASPARVGSVIEGFLATYRHTWRGTAVGSFLAPFLFLLSLGVGLGSEVDDAGRLGTSYLDFVAPGILAATAMQIAAVECTWPVMAGMRWLRTFQATLATPVGVADLVAGRMGWVALRVGASTGVFLAVVAAFGAVSSPLAILAFPASVLTGLAIGAPIEAFAATRDRADSFAGIQRFIVLPTFLFAGTFFPVERLPDQLEPLVWLVPLWHGVELCRHLTFGDLGPVDVLHAGILLALAVGGYLAAVVAYSRSMRT